MGGNALDKHFSYSSAPGITQALMTVEVAVAFSLVGVVWALRISTPRFQNQSKEPRIISPVIHMNIHIPIIYQDTLCVAEGAKAPGNILTFHELQRQ